MEENELEITTDFKAFIKKDIMDKMNYISSEFELEMGAFLVGKWEGDKVIVEDMLIPEQEVTSTSVDFSTKNLIDMRKEYKDKCQDIVGEWHSHNKMGAFWSGTDDEDMINKFSEPRDKCVFIVSSKGEHMVSVVINKPFKFRIDNVPYSTEVSDEIINEIKDEIALKVKEKVYTYSRTLDDEIDTKKIKKEIEKHIKYFHRTNTVIIDKLYHSYASLIGEEFKILNPKVEIEDTEYSQVIVVLETKDKAKEFMVDVKALILKIALDVKECNKVTKDEKKKLLLDEMAEDDFEEYANWRNDYNSFDIGDRHGYGFSYNARWR